MRRSVHGARTRCVDEGCPVEHARVRAVAISAKLQVRDTGYGHVTTTPPADKLTTILQLVVQQISTSQCQSPTSRHVQMLGCGKFLPVGGEFVVQQVVELL